MPDYLRARKLDDETASLGFVERSGHRRGLPHTGWPRASVFDHATLRRVSWSSSSFSATCENEGERRAETLTRSFPRGQHHNSDPFMQARPLAPSQGPMRSWSDRTNPPRWERGNLRHAEQRREREATKRHRKASGPALAHTPLAIEQLHSPEPDARSLTVTLRVATPTAWASVRVSEQRLRHNGLSAVLDGYREALAEARRRGPSPLPGPG
jgi:hypothetical protein